MEAYNKIQMDTNKAISRAKANFKKSPKERISKAYVEVRLENLESQWTSFYDTHRKILSEIKEVDYNKSQYCLSEVYEVTEELYLDYKTELKGILTELCKKEVSQSVSPSCAGKNSNESCNIKLPKISLPMFSGQYLEWITFRDLFVSLIHCNKSLDDVQRLQYLKCHLSGEAEQLLRNVPICSSNYHSSWEQLNKRYNNKKYMASCILKRFLSQKNISNESAQSLKDLLDTSNDCLNALKNLGINVDTWDFIVIYILSLKLDSESRKLWEANISEFSEDLPTLKQFNTFLEQRFRSLEFLDNKSSKNTVTKNVPVKTLHVASLSCIFCKSDHKLGNCKKFCNEDVTSRRNFVQSNGLCFNCLGLGHTVYSCRLLTRCRLCKRKHHSLLHAKDVPVSTDPKVEPKQSVDTQQTQDDASNIVTNCAATSRSHDLLPTALVKVTSGTGTEATLRSLLDQCSQASYITESAVQLLGLKKYVSYKSSLRLGEDDKGCALTSKYVVYFRLQSMYNPNFRLSVKAHVQKKLTSILPSNKIKFPLWKELEQYNLADPTWDTPGKIDILLSSSVYSKVLKQGLSRGPPGSLIAQDSELGWILSGEITGKEENSETFNYVTLEGDQNELIKRFWELEETIVPKKHFTEEEQKCEEFYKQSTQRDPEGRYVVRLPFKTSTPQCVNGQTKDIALRRFLNLEKRLTKDSELKRQYVGVINEYLDLGHAEIIPLEQINKPDVVYLPHHAVIREDKATTKVRVVFDASSLGKNGVSLNSELMVGPSLQADLRHTIMRWRMHPICIVADIVKMYRQVIVSTEDIDYQRLLWRQNPRDQIQHLRLLRVTFGTASAPYLAVRTLHQIALDEGEHFPIAREKTLTDFYMDDLMTGCQNIEEGKNIYEQMIQLLGKAGFELQKWNTNDSELMNYMSIDKDEGNLELKTDIIMKILGLTWSRRTDEFEYSVTLPPLKIPVTKRSVISHISMLFDPLGWLAPVIITAKILIQKLWLSGIHWDDELPSILLKEWFTYRSEIEQLVQYRIPRWLSVYNGDSVELHGFSDASNQAYAAVVYMRVVDQKEVIYARLVTAKTKVAPIKQVSIPRLELCGAVLLSKLLSEVAEVLKIEKQKIHAWTDSSVVLAWLSKHPSNWQTFVANRVSEILTVVDRSQWAHVKSADNPADCASRGLRSTELISNQLWMEGPVWLKNRNIDYSKNTECKTVLEEKVKKMSYVTTDECMELSVWSKFSTLRKLIRVIAYCRRFIVYCKGRKDNSERSPPWLTAKELDEALTVCIKQCQRQYFSTEIEDLVKMGKVQKKSVLTSLNPFVDHEGLLRVGGRLERATITENLKHPIIVPAKSHFTDLLIADTHQKTLHGGPQLMLNYLRSRYWVLNAKNRTKFYVRNCVSCVRHAARIREQLMGQLPKARVTASRPFYQSGVDYAGPINIRTSKGRGHHSYKGYICLFVCMATRAIHLEAVSDLTSNGFIAAFKRFVARRGQCVDLYSDNGTNFVGAAKELKVLLAAEKSSLTSEIAEWLSNNGTNWHFIPPQAPNFGGLWEAGIKSTKHHLKRVVGNNTLTYEEMATVLSQIEACLNSRPISQLSDNIQDQTPLTPGHFLVGEPLVLVPELNYEQSTITSLKRWQLTQRMVQDFWRRWSKEYLTLFMNRYKWAYQTPEPAIGDIVLVKEDNLPPARWLYGIITQKHPGLDGITRVVSLRCKGSQIKRPVSKICVLPVGK